MSKTRRERRIKVPKIKIKEPNDNEIVYYMTLENQREYNKAIEAHLKHLNVKIENHNNYEY